MKDIIIILLVIFLLITIFYLFLLKKGIKKFNKDLNQKLKDKSNTILTTNFSDRDLCHLIDSINNSLKSYNDIRIDYEKKNNCSNCNFSCISSSILYWHRFSKKNGCRIS